MKEIKYVCSMGFVCHVARLLQRLNIKLCSYPFDWTFTPFKTVSECLKDDFKSFMDREQYIPFHAKKCGHKQYNNQRVLWNHHNPRDNPEDYAYVVRCVERFRALLKKPGSKLFIFFKVKGRENLLEQALLFEKVLSTVTTNYTILLIYYSVSTEDKRHHTWSKNGNIDCLELFTLSASSGVTFKNKEDNEYLESLLKGAYQFNLDQDVECDHLPIDAWVPNHQ